MGGSITGSSTADAGILAAAAIAATVATAGASAPAAGAALTAGTAGAGAAGAGAAGAGAGIGAGAAGAGLGAGAAGAAGTGIGLTAAETALLASSPELVSGTGAALSATGAAEAAGPAFMTAMGPSAFSSLPAAGTTGATSAGISPAPPSLSGFEQAPTSWASKLTPSMETLDKGVKGAYLASTAKQLFFPTSPQRPQGASLPSVSGSGGRYVPVATSAMQQLADQMARRGQITAGRRFV